MRVQDALRELRYQMGLSQEKMARYLGVTVVTISRFERRQPPRGKWLLRFTSIAEECGRPDLADAFRGAFAEQFHLEDYGPLLSIRYNEHGEPCGVLVQPFEGYAALRVAIETSEQLKAERRRHEGQALSGGHKAEGRAAGGARDGVD